MTGRLIVQSALPPKPKDVGSTGFDRVSAGSKRCCLLKGRVSTRKEIMRNR
jgi:hypothetical protein